jgi:hypothetical protein
MSFTVERKLPRISLNALTAYLAGTPTRRRRIIADQKRPQAVGMMYYQPAQTAITRFLASSGRNESLLRDAMQALHAQPTVSEFEQHRWQSNAQAIEALLEFHHGLERPGYVGTPGGNIQPKLEFGGLDLSVRPDVILRNDDANHEPSVGAIRLYFGKHDPLSETIGRYSSAILLEFLRQFHVDRKAVPRATLVVDVFARRIHEAPASSQRLMSDVRAACGEIARMWEVT